ncbi:uncharacterized protein METZ01_LOCUS195386 [marine metagenome]|uniref:Uncharacterized protein n=1 Tax=marine metagenome TaxID=408172 RepID=A0A382DWR5_9ZZZZ
MKFSMGKKIHNTYLIRIDENKYGGGLGNETNK